jgi:hypothetical protein
VCSPFFRRNIGNVLRKCPTVATTILNDVLRSSAVTETGSALSTNNNGTAAKRELRVNNDAVAFGASPFRETECARKPIDHPTHVLVNENGNNCRVRRGTVPFHLNVLINQDRVPVWIDNHEAGRTSRFFIGFGLERDAFGFELALQIANVREAVEFLCVAVPARIKGENVFIEHSLEQPDRVIAVFENQPILRGIFRENFKAQFLVETSRGFNVFDR